MLNTAIRRFLGSNKPPRVLTRQNSQGPTAKKHISFRNMHGTPNEDSSLSKWLVSWILPALFGGFVVPPTIEWIQTYWVANRLFEGPQKDIIYLSTPVTDTYVHRQGKDVNQIRRELTPSPLSPSTPPYVVIWSPSGSGSTTLLSKLAEQCDGGIRYLPQLRNFFCLMGERKMMSWWETMQGRTLEMTEKQKLERQKELLLYAADKYQEKHGTIPTLVIDQVYTLRAEDHVKLWEYKTWAAENSHRLKVVFVPKALHNVIPRDLLGPERPRLLSLEGFTNDEAKKFLRLKFGVDVPPNNKYHASKWWRYTTAKDSSRQILSREDVIYEINDLVDNVIGGDFQLIQSIEHLNSRDKIEKDIQQSVRYMNKDTCEKVYLANGPVPLRTLSEAPKDGYNFRVNPVNETVDFIAPGYRKAYEKYREEMKENKY